MSIPKPPRFLKPIYNNAIAHQVYCHNEIGEEIPILAHECKFVLHNFGNPNPKLFNVKEPVRDVFFNLFANLFNKDKTILKRNGDFPFAEYNQVGAIIKPTNLHIVCFTKIFKGDWFLQQQLKVIGQWKNTTPYNSVYKIVATTDESLGLPIIPDEIVHKFITEKLDKFLVSLSPKLETKIFDGNILNIQTERYVYRNLGFNGGYSVLGVDEKDISIGEYCLNKEDAEFMLSLMSQYKEFKNLFIHKYFKER